MKKIVFGMLVVSACGWTFGETISLAASDAKYDVGYIESFSPGRAYYNWGGVAQPAATAAPSAGNDYLVPNGLELRHDDGPKAGGGKTDTSSYSKRGIFGGDSLQLGETAAGSPANGFAATVVKDTETLAAEGLVRYVMRTDTIGMMVIVK